METAGADTSELEHLKSKVFLSQNIDESADNDLWYALAAGALCVAGIVATGIITSVVNKDDK